MFCMLETFEIRGGANATKYHMLLNYLSYDINSYKAYCTFFWVQKKGGTHLIQIKQQQT